MTEPIPNLSDAQLQRLLADLNHVSGSLTADDLHRLEEFIHRAGGIEAARQLLDTLEGCDLEEAAASDLDDLDTEALDTDETTTEEIEWDDVDEADEDDRVAA